MSFITPASPPVTGGISGQVVTISGQTVSITSISGTGITTSVSGQTVVVSGNVVNVSGQPAGISGQIVRISGQTVGVTAVATSGLTLDDWQTITGASGGTQLNPGDGRVWLIQNLPTNSGNMHIGVQANDPPHATKGFVLTPGSAIELNVTDKSNIRVYATVSGERVANIGELSP